MKRLAKVIKAAKPDILILQEVENLKLLKAFNRKHLNFPTVALKEGPDQRGIDVGILSTLNLTDQPKLHLQKTSSGRTKKTRGILEANLKLANGESLKIFGLHFPSQGSPTRARKEAINLLNTLLKKSSGLVVAGGDFNIVEKESFLYNENLAQNWKVSHLMGCEKCKGTNYYRYKRSWSFLDALLFSKNFDQTWKIDRKSIRVFNDLPLQNSRYKTPAKFNNGHSPFGVSDHWPVVVDIFLGN